MRKFIICGLPMSIIITQIVSVGFLSLYGEFFFSGPAGIPRKSELIVVLGGNMMFDRLKRGAELYREGWGEKILVTGFSEPNPPSEDWRLRYLKRYGVEGKSIITDFSSTSSWQEARLVRRLMKDNGWSHVLVVSDPPHLRRLSWIYEAIVNGDMSFTLISSSPAWWIPHYWWKNSDAVSFALQELIKMIYYKFEYGV
ncbi:YdcF family protein [Methylococcus sp. EFPC2]|uniref:YdcF family protein n=1 Tax=Methylococcus sp. EFPC2 TaxID=2812648 RepID=UPI001967B963|nr:YdcF family protein [Methylococcus sp. EFPC2]QSA98929.1 YdcF family protein [Methylococcus sp. EFPC2]